MYDELIAALRHCSDISDDYCLGCPLFEYDDGFCVYGEWEFAAEILMSKAAAAIEELSKRVDESIIAPTVGPTAER